MERLRLLRHLVAKTDATNNVYCCRAQSLQQPGHVFLQTDTFSFRFGFQFVTLLLKNTNTDAY